MISIHAPREGSDQEGDRRLGINVISIHAPREGSDLPCLAGSLQSKVSFLSTLPARGATGGLPHYVKANFISIHAPREGSDPQADLTGGKAKQFLSTLPARGATS